MKIVILGAGVQGTFYGVQLALAGHLVTLIARDGRAAELRSQGAAIEHALSGHRSHQQLPVVEDLNPSIQADVCLVTVRREQLESVLPAIAAARGIDRVVFMVNHACDSTRLFAVLERRRVVLGFPCVAGGIENGVCRYVDVKEQPTALEASARDIAKLFRTAGLKVTLVADMESWLRRHVIFVTAVSGALYEVAGDAHRLASDKNRVRRLILAIREGWMGLDRCSVAPAPLALRAIFQWVPLTVAVRYWSRLLDSPRGEYYFARHARHAAREMEALAADIRALIPVGTAPLLRELYCAIDRTARASRAS